MEGAQYLEEAERMGREGIEVLNEEEEGTKTVVATWGEKVVGVAVVRQGELWAWTVLLRYRRSGLGRDLLARVVKEAGEEGVKGVAKDNASEYFFFFFFFGKLGMARVVLMMMEQIRTGSRDCPVLLMRRLRATKSLLGGY